MNHRPKLELGVRVRAMLLTTIPDSTSQKFILLGSLTRKDQNNDGKYVVIHLDFAPMRSRVCERDDLEKWYARGRSGHECIMGHKASLTYSLDPKLHLDNALQQWFWRRKAGADCYMGNKFKDPVSHEENCPCTDADYEWYVLFNPFQFHSIYINTATIITPGRVTNVCQLAQSQYLRECAPAMHQDRRIRVPPATASSLETLAQKKTESKKTIPKRKIVRKVRNSQNECSRGLTFLLAEAPEGGVVHQIVNNIPLVPNYHL